MSDVNLIFLGEEYSIPEELRVFVEYLHYFETIHNEIMPLLTTQIRAKKYSSGAEEDFIYFKAPLTKVGEKVIVKLTEKNIFDATLNDIVYNNRGYIQLHNICEYTFNEMANILMRAITSFEDGYVSAYSSAASNITGSGISIWTNSLSSALIYSALESSTLKKQADKANKEYSDAISSLDKRITDNQTREENNLLLNKYYPGVAEALSLFVSEMMEYYITKLEQNGAFDYFKVKSYNLQRSSDLLKNFSIVSDKSKLLKEAFICCPYNPDVYNAVIENKLTDIATFETAKYFLQDKILTDAIEKYIKENTDNIDLIEIPVKILSLYKEQNEQSIWKIIYSDDYKQFCKYYNNLNNVIKERDSLMAWTEDNITNDAVALCDMDKGVLANKIEKTLRYKIITDKKFSLFKELGIIDKDCKIPWDFETLDDINSKYYDSLIHFIDKLIPELKSNIDKYMEEAEIAKQEYENYKIEYDSKFNELQSKETSLKEQRALLGIFAFSKKKEIDTKILECQTEISELKKSDKSQKFKNKYELLLDKAHSLYI